MQGLSDSTVLIALISAITSIVGTLITVRAKRHVNKKNLPTDSQRKGVIYDGYENLIKGQQEEIDRKTKLIGHLETLVDQLDQDLRDTRNLLEETKMELKQAKHQNLQMKTQLDQLRKEP